MPKIEMGKKYQTRDGKPVRILAIDRKGGSFPVIALISNSDGSESAGVYTASGAWRIDSAPYLDDLVPVKVKKKVWIGVFERAHGDKHVYVSTLQTNAEDYEAQISNWTRVGWAHIETIEREIEVEE